MKKKFTLSTEWAVATPRRWVKPSAVVLMLGGMASAPANAQQPPSLQFNVAYHCPNDSTVVVDRCESKTGSEYCFVRAGLHGQLGKEVMVLRSQLTALPTKCSMQASGAAVNGGQSAGNAKAFNPPYLSEMPSVNRVIEAMKTNDPRETAVRQIWAFYELTEVIKTLSGPREFRGLLPDEQKILGDYQVAQYQVGQVADKAFPGNKPSEDLTYHYGRWDPKFGFKGINIWQFFSENLQSQFAQIVAGDNARYAAKRAEEKRIAAEALNPNAQAAVPGVQQGMKNDPGRVAARRCLESGRSELDCLGEGLKVGLNDLTGGDLVANITGEKPPEGLRLSGAYSAGNKFGISFSQEKVSVGCGTLIPQSIPYIVDRAPNQISIKIPISPKPIVLALKPNGTLAGPAEVAVNGLVPVGHGGGGGGAGPALGYEEQTHTTTQQRQIDAAEARNYEGTDAVHQNGMEYSVSEQVTTTTYEPVAPVANYKMAQLAPRTERSPVGILQGRSRFGGVGEALTQIVDPSAKKKGPVPPGLRLAGMYSGQDALRIEFREDSATVECGEAHVADAYVVQENAGQISVRIQNGGTPFALSLQPNGTLVGSGTIDVAGRVVTGSRGDAITYAPRNARCAIGTLTQKTGK